MPIEPPNLDERRYQDLFEEMKALIPRYAPEWTDHNPSDPGITMLQLFAWLSEISLYRLNRVPDRNYIKFLQLLGIEQQPPVPARAELTFTLRAPKSGWVLIPAGTQVESATPAPTASALDLPQLAPPQQEAPVVFETDEPLTAIGAQLSAVQVFNGGEHVNYTEANAIPGDHYPALGRPLQVGNALLLGFQASGPFPTVEVNLYIRVWQPITQPRERGCDASMTQLPPPADLDWAYWDGKRWKPLQLLKDDTHALTRTGHLYFQGPEDIRRRRRLGVFQDELLYWVRCQLKNSQYDRPPELEAIVTNTVSATAVKTARDEVIGASNGEPQQRFRLRRAPIFAQPVRPVEARLRDADLAKRSPILAERLERTKRLKEQELRKGFLLEVDEGQGPVPWEEVEDFYNSAPDDYHYVLNRTTGEIQFGDGEQGHIPRAGLNNIIARYYRYGGGKRGNLGAGMLTEYLAGVDQVTNLWPAAGGDDEEPLAWAKARAPQALKTKDRAVTLEDFEFLARQTPWAAVGRAHALPLYHPQFPDIEVPGVVTVIVIPDSDDRPPIPSQYTMKAVCAYLNQRRLLTTELFVAAPRYWPVRVEATVVAQPAIDPFEVANKVKAALNDYLHPITGGDDGQGWPLGGAVLYSQVYRVVLKTEGVAQIDELRLVVNGERKAPCENAGIPKNYLIYAGTHEIEVDYG
jgi:hypothetical protein